MIQLNYRDSRPIYEQVSDGLRNLLIRGVIQAGEKLPSVRALAASLTINPNTIQRAYEALEQEGYIYSIVGRGSFAADLGEVNEARREALFQRLDEAARELLALGVRAEELSARIEEMEGRKT